MWKCNNCKSSNEDNYELCWKCSFDKFGNPSENIEEFRMRLKETSFTNTQTSSKNIRDTKNPIAILGEIVSLIFFIATVYFIVTFDKENPTFSIILIISTFSNTVFFLLLSAILDSLSIIQKKK
jgi:uncharacterized membrane protein YvbJ